MLTDEDSPPEGRRDPKASPAPSKGKKRRHRYRARLSTGPLSETQSLTMCGLGSHQARRLPVGSGKGTAAAGGHDSVIPRRLQNSLHSIFKTQVFWFLIWVFLECVDEIY